MENEKFEGFENIDDYLNNIISKVNDEAGFRYQHMQYLGRELRKIIDTEDTCMKESDRIFLREAFFQAVYIEAGKPLDDPFEKEKDEDKRMCFYTIRDAMITAITKAQESPIAFKDNELLESLQAMTDLLEYGKCSKDQSLPILKFIAFTVMALSKELLPFKK